MDQNVENPAEHGMNQNPENALQQGINHNLRDATPPGSIDALYALIQEDARVLDNINDIPFVQTLLHQASICRAYPVGHGDHEVKAIIR
jgi:hypothetical protein